MVAELRAAGADLRHVDTWLFDLDNTLYPLDSGLAERVSARITLFVERLTGLPSAEAHLLQKRYLAEHGLTLRGLMDHHGVDPHAYHAFLEQTPIDCLRPDPALAAALAGLPGRRLVFTNADDRHAERVLDHLGLSDLFADIFHIACAEFLPKPDPECFARIIAAHAIIPARTAFFDDAPRNLAPAAALGMTTVLVGPAALGEAPAFVDHLAPELTQFLTSRRT